MQRDKIWYRVSWTERALGRAKWRDMLEYDNEYRLNWHLHLQRMPQNLIPLKSYHYRPQGRRTTGRPKKRWRGQL